MSGNGHHELLLRTAANGMYRLLPPAANLEGLVQTIGEAAMGGKSTDSLESLSVVGVDIGKDTFHLVGFDDNGCLVVRCKIKRLALEHLNA